MKRIYHLRTFLIITCMSLAMTPFAANAIAYYYRTYYPDNLSNYYYGAPMTSVTYPATTTDRTIVYPTATTKTYHWYNGRPGYYQYHYGAKACFLRGNQLFCW